MIPKPAATGKPEASGKCELEGFAARSRGVLREANPYNKAEEPRSSKAAAVSEARMLATAWWKGWDAANSQLT